jgi:hypothetical protein
METIQLSELEIIKNFNPELRKYTSSDWEKMTSPEILQTALPILSKCSKHMQELGFSNTVGDVEIKEDSLLYVDNHSELHGYSSHDPFQAIKTASSHNKSVAIRRESVVDLFRKYVLKESSFGSEELVNSIKHLVDRFGKECQTSGLIFDYYAKVKFTEGIYSAVGLHFFVDFDGVVVPFEFKFNYKPMEILCNEEHDSYKKRKSLIDVLYRCIATSILNSNFSVEDFNSGQYVNKFKLFMNKHLNPVISDTIELMLDNNARNIDFREELLQLNRLNSMKIAFKVLVALGLTKREEFKKSVVGYDEDSIKKYLLGFVGVNKLIQYIDVYKITYFVKKKFNKTEGLVKNINDVRELEAELKKSGLLVKEYKLKI